MQTSISDYLKNKYLFKTIKSKIFLLFGERKEIYKIDAIIKLIEESYKIEERKFTEPYNENLKYYLNNSYEHEQEYFDLFTKNIRFLSTEIDDNIQKLKEIYDKVQNDYNNSLNISLQIIMLFLTIVMMLQAFKQCSTENMEEFKRTEVDHSCTIIVKQ
jgi:hypothetical protein